jgi:foldase protein PrsA
MRTVVRGTRRASAVGAPLLIAMCLGACGATSQDSPAVQVGGTAIAPATVDHWASVMAAGSPSARQARALRERALELLLSARWAIGEAASRGVAASGAEVRRRVAQRNKSSFPGGAAELHGFLKATGMTIEDQELEAKAELASSKLRQLILNSVPQVSDAEIAAYYERHNERFAVPERRTLLNTNRKSAAGAEQVKREVAAGKSFATLAFPETVQLSHTLRAFRPKSHLEVVMLEAKPHVLVGPVRRRVDYFVFEVVKIVPAGHLTLAHARATISRDLIDARRRAALTKAVHAWRTAWVARTDCRRGYVVQKCRQYKGLKSPEDPLAFH